MMILNNGLRTTRLSQKEGDTDVTPKVRAENLTFVGFIVW